MNDKPDAGQEPDNYVDISIWQRLQGVIAFGIVVWIVLSVLGHAVTALTILANPQPRIVDVRFGWPSVQISQPVQQVESGGVTPGGGITPSEGIVTDDGIDIKYHCTSNGRTVCTCTILGKPVPEVVCTLGTILVVCFTVAYILFIVLAWLCNSEWVKGGTARRRRCRRRKCKKWCLCCNKWFCWFESFVLWILKKVCGWGEYIFWGTLVICVVAALIIIFA